MYLKHFELSSLPFENLSNASVYVDLPEHRDALNTILFGLRSGEGFVKIVGEVGVGKTALCRTLLAQLDDDFIPVYLPNPSMSPTNLHRAIADELGVPLSVRYGQHEIEKYTREILLDIARQGKRVAIFADEAQTMRFESLEALRLLSNLESNRGKLAQVAFFGQPELDEKLADYSLRQLQQRIAFSARLSSLDRSACHEYVARRLMHSGAPPRPIFTRTAVEKIHLGSGGLPRLINTLCHKSLIAAFAEGDVRVFRRHVARALSDTEGISRWSTRPLFGRTTGERSPSRLAVPSWRSLSR